MSGGRFDFKQHYIEDIAYEIEHIIGKNNVKNERGYSYDFSAETIKKLKEAVITLRRAEAMAQRIDWLVCADDSEKTFHEQWDKELRAIK